MEGYIFIEKDHPLSFRAKTTEVAMTEYSGNNAWIYNGNNGNMNNNNKSLAYYVRPVTEFH